CAVRLVPAGYPAGKTLAENPDGVVFSAGPGIPERRPEALSAAREFFGRLPLWGVGIGAGILAAAMGARIVVNNRSHIGVQPVGRAGEPSGEMTAQCHDFWIEAESLAEAGLAPTHFHLNDGSVEGFKSDALQVIGVLFHPEAEPGPRDSLYLFDLFFKMLNERRKNA
ncbi:MAG: carbamoyl phosphate synthase small subunit, partial [Planctomycetes bacterium]|nr:carbamoyl phosphate synthase small subunit [Planctomycetota bacterium]